MFTLLAYRPNGMLFVQQMIIGAVINASFVQKADETPVVALRRCPNIAFDTMVAGNLRLSMLNGNLRDSRCDRMSGDITEGSWNGRDELFQKSFGIVGPHAAAALDPIILPIELRLSVALRQYFKKFAEHEKSADRHKSDHYNNPKHNEIHEPALSIHGLYSPRYELYRIPRFISILLVQ